LPKFNLRFSVKAKEQSNLHRPAPRDQELRNNNVELILEWFLGSSGFRVGEFEHF